MLFCCLTSAPSVSSSAARSDILLSCFGQRCHTITLAVTVTHDNPFKEKQEVLTVAD